MKARYAYYFLQKVGNEKKSGKNLLLVLFADSAEAQYLTYTNL